MQLFPTPELTDFIPTRVPGQTPVTLGATTDHLRVRRFGVVLGMDLRRGYRVTPFMQGVTASAEFEYVGSNAT